MVHIYKTVLQIPKALKVNNYFPTAKKALFILFCIDLVFILLHAYSLFLPLRDETRQLRLDMDFGYAEIFQYFQFIGTALLLTAFFFKKRSGIYLIWAMFFLVMFFDDAFAFHETFSSNVIELFNISPAFGLRTQDLGELIIAGMLGGTFILPFAHALWFGKRKAREVTVHLIILVGILVFFGVGFDMLHSILKSLPGSGILTVMEDAGEMVAASLMLCYGFCLHLREGNRKFSIRKGLKP